MMLALRGFVVTSDSSPHHEPGTSVRTFLRSPVTSATQTSQVPALIR